MPLKGKRAKGGAVNLTQLGYFEAVYEKRSYTAAAKSIPMTHQGLVKSMSTLQKELGVPLFVTEGDASMLVPTEFGRAFHDFAQNVRGEADQLDHAFEMIKTAGNTLRLGSSTGVLGLLGSGFLPSFRSEYPDVTVADEELPDLLCEEGLRDGRYDLAFTVTPFDDEFNTVALYSMDRYLWIPARDRLAAADSVRIGDIAGYCVGVMGKSFKSYPVLLDLALEAGVEFAQIDTSSELFWLSQYAHQAHHVAFTAGHVVCLFSNDTGIAARRFEGFPWGFGISWHKGHELTAQEKAFVKHCAAFARKRADRGEEGFVAD